MKKLLALILVLALGVSCALADLPDVAGMTDADLQELNRAVQLEILSRAAATGFLVPPGEGYIVGQDIPAGTYRLEYAGDEYGYAILAIDRHDGNISNVYSLGLSYPTYIGKVILKKGHELKIVGQHVRFVAYTGIVQ